MESDHCLSCRRELDKKRTERTCIHCEKTGRIEDFATPNVCGPCDEARRKGWAKERRNTVREITCRVCKKKSMQKTYRGFICSPCHNKKCQENYKANKAKIKKRSKRSLERSRARNKAYIDKIRSETPCADCSKFFQPEGMDFDHLPGFEKSDHVSALAQRGCSIERLQEEINKCEVVCAVCHRTRTKKRRARKPRPVSST